MWFRHRVVSAFADAHASFRYDGRSAYPDGRTSPSRGLRQSPSVKPETGTTPERHPFHSCPRATAFVGVTSSRRPCGRSFATDVNVARIGGFRGSSVGERLCRVRHEAGHDPQERESSRRRLSLSQCPYLPEPRAINALSSVTGIGVERMAIVVAGMRMAYALLAHRGYARDLARGVMARSDLAGPAPTRNSKGQRT